MISKGFGRWGWMIQVVAFVTLITCTVTAHAWDIEGTVTNSSGKTGSRVYIGLNGQDGGNATYGVSIPAPAPDTSAVYTIRGVPDGNYVASAFLDRRTTTSATHHANDPVGSSQAIVVAGAASTNADITLTLPDPIEATPLAPTLNGVIPGPGSALVDWDTPTNNNENEIAYSYNVYWHTDNTVSPANCTGKKNGIPARDNGMYIQTMLNPATSTALVDGTTLWYVVTGQFGINGQAGSVEGPASNTFGPVTIGAIPSDHTSSFDVSGTVNLDPAITPITGPLLMAIYTDGPGTRLFKIDNPGTSNSFTVTGLPNGSYHVFSLVDQNKDGVVWTGDYTVGERNAPAITVDGANVSGITSTVPKKDVEASVTTSHYIDASSQEGYGLDFNIRQAFKQPVNVTVLAGQDVAGPIDLAVRQSGDFSYWINDVAKPTPGTQYTLDLVYSDDSIGTETVTVTAVLDSFADPVSPKGNVTFNATPMFSWAAPLSPPDGYTYSLNLNGNNLWWDTDSMLSSQTSALFNFDDRANSSTLADNVTYIWEIAVNDVNGNKARKQASFFSGGSISGTVMGSDTGSGVAGIFAQLYDSNGNNMPWNYTATTAADGSFVIGGLQTGTYRVCFWSNQTGYVAQCYDSKDFNGSQATNISVNYPNNTALNAITLAKSATITGTVTASGGGPIQGVWVELHDINGNGIPGPSQAQTDATGNYTLSGFPAGEYKLYFNGAAQGYIGQWYDGKNDSTSATQITLSTGQPQTANATLTLGGIISGQVTNGTIGIQDVWVQLRDENGIWIPNINGVTTDSSGNYIVGGIPTGNYKLYFDGMSAGYIGQWFNGVTDQSAATVLAVVAGGSLTGKNAVLAQGATITGRVTSNGTIGIQGISVQLRDINGYGIPNINSPMTDPSGNFTMSGIPSGTYKLYFDGGSAGYIGQWYNGATIFVVTAGNTYPGFNAQLAQGATITGRVTSNGTTGIQNVWVQLRDENGSWIPNFNSPNTDSSGNFTLGGIPNGTYKLYFDGGSSGYIGQWYNGANTFDVTAGNSYPGFNAQLAQGTTISGTVTNGASGIQNISVQLYNSTGMLNLLNTNTDVSGGYQFSGLQAGTYRVCFSAGQTNYIAKCYNNLAYNSSSATDITVSVPGGNNAVNATLTQGGGISGQITNGISGIQNISVEIRDTMNGNLVSGVFGAWTDGNGNYDIHGIPAGNIKVYFNPNGTSYAGQWYNNKTSFANSDNFVINAGATGTVNAVLQAATVPGAPTITSITPGDWQAQVNFDIPTSDGGLPIFDYTVTANPGNLTGFGLGSPITVAGLTNGQQYTISVTARNNLGNSAAATTSYYAPFRTGVIDLQTAATAATAGGAVWALSGPVTLSSPPLLLTKGVNLSGGYNFDYSTVSGYTTITGGVAIRGTGFKVIFKNVKVK